MEHRDAIVVGGGPAGSTLARALHQAGLEVALLDRAVFPRDKLCAGWITPPVIEELGLDVNDYARGRVFQPLRGFRLGLEGDSAPQAFVEPEPVSFGIRRCEFDDYLLRRSGAELRLGVALGEMVRDGSDWIVNGELRSPLVVGAAGHFCPVARLLGARPGAGETAVYARETEVVLTPAQLRACPVDPEVPEIYFCRDLRGYAWVFRKGNVLNLGLGRDEPGGLTERAGAFVEFLLRQGKVPADTSLRLRGHAYLLYPHGRRRLVDDGVLLVGDACGLAYAESGEGIRPAVESALLAARVVRNAGGVYGRERLAPYAAQVASRFGARVPRPRLVHRLPRSARRLFAGPLLRSSWFARHVVLRRWFLHAHESALGAG